MRHNSCALLWERNEPFRPSLFVCCCFSCSHTTRRLLHFANDQLPKIHWGCYLKSELHDNNVGQWLLTMVLQSSNLIFSPSQGLPLCLGLKNETFRYTPLTCLTVLKGQRDGVSCWQRLATCMTLGCFMADLEYSHRIVTFSCFELNSYAAGTRTFT